MWLMFHFIFEENIVCMPQHLCWVHPINQIHGQPGKGEFHSQVQELKSYPDRFYQYFCMPLSKYFELLNRLKSSNLVTKQNMNWCNCIGAEERMAVFLR